MQVALNLSACECEATMIIVLFQPPLHTFAVDVAKLKLAHVAILSWKMIKCYHLSYSYSNSTNDNLV